MTDDGSRSAGVNPYHCYIRLEALTPLHERATGWPGEAHFRCGFAAVELHLGLMHTVAADHRPFVARQDRDTELADSLVQQLGLLTRGFEILPPPSGDLLTASAPSSLSFLCEALPKVSSDLLWLAHAVGGRVAGLPAWSGASSLSAAPFLPYDEWVDPRGLWTRASADPYGAEDLTFRTVHQVFESWFCLIESTLRYGETLIAARHWAGAAATTNYVADVLHFLGTHIRVLDHMNLEEYDPLRVALKSASGAQSAGAASAMTTVSRQYDRYAAARDTARPIGRILRDPASAPGEYRYVNALARLEAALSDLLHSHYYRAIRVQSRRGLGSLGGGIDGLLARTVRPLFPQLDEARFEHLLYKNWRHADIQGTLIGPLTRTSFEPAPPAPVAGSVAASVLSTFDAAFRTGDTAACAALFEPITGCVQDGPGTRHYRGTVEVTDYFNSVFQAMTVTALRPGSSGTSSAGASSPGEDSATAGPGTDVTVVVVDAELDLTAVTGRTATLPVRWELELCPTGRISVLRVGWDTTAIADLMLSG